MVDPIGMTYWSGHSMRHFLPTVAAAIDISKEQRDYVGRWHINLHQSADYVHTSRQMVHQVQESVNKAICEGVPSYDESELMEDFACYLTTKGRSPGEWIKPHAVWKQVDGNYLIGGKWPTLGEDVYEEEIWADQSDQVVEAALEEQPTDSVVTEEIVQPKAPSSSLSAATQASEGCTRLDVAACNHGPATKSNTWHESPREQRMQFARPAREQQVRWWMTMGQAHRDHLRPRKWKPVSPKRTIWRCRWGTCSSLLDS